MIYADHAATTRLRDCALQAMMPFLTDCYANASGAYPFGQAAKKALEDARRQIADCIHAAPSGIIFTSGGSESDNQAIRSAAEIGARSDKKHIISAAFEHHAVLRTLDALRADGWEITLLDVGERGIVSAEQVAAAIRPDTALVSVMFANNEIGTIQPAAEIGAVCRQRGVLFHTDAVQATGHLPIDTEEMQIDLLSASAHKFGGPKGAGFLYARRGVALSPLIYGGAQERNRRAGTENIPAIVGMAAALAEACAEMETESAAVRRQRDAIIAALSEIPESVLNGDAEMRLPSNISFCFAGIESETLLLLLGERGICASVGSACASGAAEPSHVLRAIGRSDALARGALRLTIGAELTDSDRQTLIAAVRENVERLRAISHR